MPCCQPWILSLLAPVFACLLLIALCQHAEATSKHSDQSSLSLSNLYNLEGSPNPAAQKQIGTTTLVTAPYNASIVYSVFPNGDESVYPNEQIVYNLRVTHDKDSTTSGLILTSTVSSAFVLEESFVLGATIVELTSYPTFTWLINDLQPAGEAVIYLVGRVDPTRNQAGLVTNSISLFNEYETVPDDNELALSHPITLPSISLSTYTQNVNEANVQTELDIQLNFPNPHGDSHVDFETISHNSSTGATSQEDYRPISGTLTISQARSSEQFFIDILDDAIDENSETIQVKLFNPRGVSLDASDLLTVTIVDNDGAGILVEPLALELPENGALRTYSMTLTSQPPEDIYININSSSDNAIVDKQVITFTAANWQNAQTIAVSPVDNESVQGDQTIILSHEVNSLDPIYNSQTASDVTANIVEDDQVGVILSTATLTTTEDADTASNSAYTIVLNSEPTAPVSITLQAEEQLQLSTNNITFTPATWETPQTITVAATDDDVAEGVHSSTIDHTIESSDANYAALAVDSVDIAIADNDESGIRISTNLLTVTEASAAGTYTIALKSQPPSPVDIMLSSSNASIEILPHIVQFTPKNWQIPQIISVSARSNNEVTNSQMVPIDLNSQSDDTNYNLLTEAITVTINDGDTASFETTTNSIEIFEGRASSSQPSVVETGVYDAILTSRPASTVTVTISHTQEITVTPASLFIPPDGWATPQQIVISVGNDSTFQGHRTVTLTHQLSSADPNYNARNHPVTVRINDDDLPLLVSVTDEELVEGTSSQSVTIALVKQPTSTVTITLTTNDQLSVEPPIITFTNNNWETPQPIALLVMDDEESENEQHGIVSFGIESADKNYNSDTNTELFQLPISDVKESPRRTVFLPTIER